MATGEAVATPIPSVWGCADTQPTARFASSVMEADLLVEQTGGDDASRLRAPRDSG
jgi:hypothetical protein